MNDLRDACQYSILSSRKQLTGLLKLSVSETFDKKRRLQSFFVAYRIPGIYILHNYTNVGFPAIADDEASVLVKP